MFSLWRKARRENSAASRLLGSTSLRFALHGWQRGCEAAGIGQYPEFQLPIGKGELCGFPRIMRHRERRHFDITDTEGWCMGAEQLQFRNVTTVGIPPGAVRHPHGHSVFPRQGTHPLDVITVLVGYQHRIEIIRRQLEAGETLLQFSQGKTAVQQQACITCLNQRGIATAAAPQGCKLQHDRKQLPASAT
nr:hypothetical protein [Thiolapillus sp.]